MAWHCLEKHLLKVVSMEMTCFQKCVYFVCMWVEWNFFFFLYIKLTSVCVGMSFSIVVCPSLLKEPVFFLLNFILLSAPLKAILSQRTFCRSRVLWVITIPGRRFWFLQQAMVYLPHTHLKRRPVLVPWKFWIRITSCLHRMWRDASKDNGIHYNQ